MSDFPAVPFVDLVANDAPHAREISAAIARVIQRGWYILGPELEAFENEFASYCGAAQCVGMNSGTDALHLALLACGIGPGDEVITVSHTFIATALAIAWTGATPVFVDVEPRTYTMDVEQAAAAITPRTRAILPVHLYGQCADMRPIVELGRRHGLRVIEDAAQAHGATYHGRRAGSLADAACFSFYPTKNLGAYGDGGAVATSDAGLADALRRLRNYGQSRKYHHESIGYNTRLDEMQAAVLRTKLKSLDANNQRRQQIAGAYCQQIDPRFDTPKVADGRESVFHLYIIQSEARDRLQQHLAGHGIQTQVHYPIPVHLQKAFDGTGIRKSLQVTEWLATRVLSLPMHPSLTDEQICHVAAVVNAFDSNDSTQ